MRWSKVSPAVGLAVVGGLTCFAAPVAAAPPAADVVPVEWRHREIRFSYVGFTTAYVCDALEGQVRRVLVYLGARKDVKVSATCPQGPAVPSGQSLVTADFQVPAPLEGPDTAATQTAHWSAIRLDARHPDFMGKGDCELLQAMREPLTKSFAVRDLKYVASCFPHDLGNDDFLVTGEVLKVDAAR